ncbi:elongation factor P [candidate division CPR3 bacterium GWF2_35_18]|uniref:Elongation factor P n=1 Tax=candidate division CPR3 bacterium GW2011_GWF2_35_18 TaxID=1618350 RepID=A0A0G0BKE3_UNCC3|nr:MAG: Elongation factor P [candidate division CPR3 bacterium GW2011_GWF2_35_18]OGB62718.1 MAG: elongation factor P [candidate division CPR3 bacterium GWF2_35_18]OGB65744.1 MAG: elongation factor P [candidate division CPR3 bacterium RIFOXYA2_FULL_35_13]OGB76448.1 MAG: elongation factor P [candidate division CPR3 bacterium RIFOXYC2_FULL_35_7]OGB79037.1 MAG: elongation factor P [candidate division CPR3 bacterium RIFOXYB2_FULL_35_8]
MTYLPVNSFKNGTFFKENGMPYEVIKYEHVKTGRGNATIRLKARNVKKGTMIEKSFPSGSKLEEADMNKKKVQFLYGDPKSGYFMDLETYEQFDVDREKLEGKIDYLKEGEQVYLLDFEGEIIGAVIPLSVTLKVTEAGPSEKGDSTSSVTKPATLETGVVVQVPMFIKVGDLVKIDTRNGSYSERVTNKN